MVATDPLLADVRDGIATLTLNRPEVLNAFTAEMGHELESAYRFCDTEDDVRVVLLTGSGRAFCSGADLSRGADAFGTGGEGFRADPFDFHAWDVRKPVIAAVNGPAIGLGLTMALHCDLRIVAADAQLGVVQVRRGVMPDLRSHWTLPRLVGYARATELLLTGCRFSGVEAAAWGLANEVTDAAHVLDRATELARELAVHVAPLSAAFTKRLLWREPPPSRDHVGHYETELHRHLMNGPDVGEGVRAFLESRDPKWTGSVTHDWPDWLDT